MLSFDDFFNKMDSFKKLENKVVTKEINKKIKNKVDIGLLDFNVKNKIENIKAPKISHNIPKIDKLLFSRKINEIKLKIPRKNELISTKNSIQPLLYTKISSNDFKNQNRIDLASFYGFSNKILDDTILENPTAMALNFDGKLTEQEFSRKNFEKMGLENDIDDETDDYEMDIESDDEIKPDTADEKKILKRKYHEKENPSRKKNIKKIKVQQAFQNENNDQFNSDLYFEQENLEKEIDIIMNSTQDKKINESQRHQINELFAKNNIKALDKQKYKTSIKKRLNKELKSRYMSNHE
jgi:hypothetical protein